MFYIKFKKLIVLNQTFFNHSEINIYFFLIIIIEEGVYMFNIV